MPPQTPLNTCRAPGNWHSPVINVDLLQQATPDGRLC